MNIATFTKTKLLLAIAGALTSALFAIAIPTPSYAFTLGTPQNVAVENGKKPKTVTVSWDAVENADSYTVRVYRANGETLGITYRVKGTSYTLSKKKLDTNKKYYVRVRAFSFDAEPENGDLSASIEFRTNPARVQQVAVLQRRNKQADVQWVKPRGKISFYRVQVRNTKGKLIYSRKVKGNGEYAQSTTVKKLKKNKKYRLRVTAAYNKAHKGPSSYKTIISKKE